MMKSNFFVMSRYVALTLSTHVDESFQPIKMSELSAEAVAAFAKFDKTLPRSCWWDNGVLKMGSFTVSQFFCCH
jgi:hypothetical protein